MMIIKLSSLMMTAMIILLEKIVSFLLWVALGFHSRPFKHVEYRLKTTTRLIMSNCANSWWWPRLGLTAVTKSSELIVRLGQCMAHLIVKEWAFLNSSRGTGTNQMKPSTIKSNCHHHHFLNSPPSHSPSPACPPPASCPRRTSWKPTAVCRQESYFDREDKNWKGAHLAPIRSIACKNSLKPR